MTGMSAADAALSDLHQRLMAIASDRSASRLCEKMSSGSWVYGAGNYGRRIAALMKAKGIECLGFIDRRGDSTKELDGMRVVTPLNFSADQAQDRCFVLAVQNPAFDADELLPFAEGLPFRHILWNADLPEALGDEANTVWLSSRSFLLEHFSQIEKVARALSDEESLKSYLSLILYRFTGRRDDYPSWDLPTQYLPPDLPGFSRPIVFVDGGAYTGDTGMMLRKRGVTLREWWAFEPDGSNFARLVNTARASGVPASLFPCGLSDRLEQARFESNLGVGSRLAGANLEDTIMIQCVAFDDVAQNVKPDFIKLDIEGAEIAALNGMARTIAANRPRLAISSYHKPQDIWEIPLKLLDLLPDANLHIRQHAMSGWETVAYAIPRDQIA